MALDLNKAASRNGKRTERILLGICSCVVGILMLIYLVWILLQAGKRIPFAASVFANVNAAGLVIPGAAALAMLFFLLYSAVGSLAAGRQKILAGGYLAGYKQVLKICPGIVPLLCVGISLDRGAVEQGQ